MGDDLDKFYDHLKRGPALLFLGQRHPAIESGQDPFLSEVLRKYGGGGAQDLGYHQIFEGESGKAPSAALAWMYERCKRFSPSESTKIISEFVWSSLYTSLIDVIWYPAFRKEWRELEPIFEESYKPSDPRNRFKLHCTFLFGCVNRTDDEQRPPLTSFEWRKRKQIAVALARRIPEIITPKGTLVIEGYSEHDWFPPEELFPIIDLLGPQQTHIFRASDKLTNDPDARQLVKTGKLTFHSMGLAEAMLRGQESGFLKLGLPPEEELLGRRISTSEKVAVVPHDIWVQTVRSAIVLDDTVLAEASPLSDEARYREFRNFLANANGRPQWTAYARGFAFVRKYEKALRREVEEQLAQKRLADKPIILHGQTGTGKTVALGHLAFVTRRSLKHPVLFIERKLQRPLPADIDRFCKWAEDAGAPASLVIWDGMVNQEDYTDCLNYLTSKGRKVVLVGSCYGIADEYSREARFVRAPAGLSPEEISELRQFLLSLDPAIGTVLERVSQADESFLVTLYRLLPETRSRIRTGVSGEAAHAEGRIIEKSRQPREKLSARTALEYALLEAGLISAETLTSAKTVDGEEVTEIQDFTNLVMVFGQFGLTVPLELLTRAWGKKALWRLPNLFEDTDFFQWIEDAVGNVEVGSRNGFEASLVVQGRLGGAKLEAQYIGRLLLAVHESGTGFGEDREVSFAVELVRAVTRQENRFAPYLRGLSHDLRQLREKSGVVNPRLMLQEANLLREWAKRQDILGIKDQSVDEAYDEVQPILNQALELMIDDRKNRRLQTFLLVELAAALASNAKHKRNSQKEAVELFNSARKAIHDARLLDSSNYHAIDILAWATLDVLGLSLLDEQTKAESLADVLHAFQVTDSADLDPRQQEIFQQRRLQYAQLLDLEEMGADAFGKLKESGSCAGYFLRALSISGLSRESKDSMNLSDPRLCSAFEYLQQQKSEISSDVRCLDLMLDLWWMINTKTRLFAGERTPLRLNQAQWQELLLLVGLQEATKESQRPVVLGFLKGLALFHLGDIGKSLEVFRNLQRDSELVRGRRRIVRSYLASTQTGEPRKFHGTVSRMFAEGSRGEVYVEELMQRIIFISREFGTDLRTNATMGEFHVAFNFLGPIADPTGYSKG
jgi:hypothetical protein